MNGQNLNVDLADYPNVECQADDCDNTYFDQAFVITVLPSVVSPTGRDEWVPSPRFVCRECGKELKVIR